MDYDKESLLSRKQNKGTIHITPSMPLSSTDDLSIAYTPGVAEPCRLIAKDPFLAYEYTIKQNFVAIVTDGSAVLGLGNIGGLAGLPVMEGKAALFKKFGGVDAIPICLDTQDPKEIIAAVKAIAPTFGGINLEDIKSPECFLIEDELNKALPIPVFHDDQHGTAIVILAGLMNALKVTGKSMDSIKVVVVGAGAAGIASTKLLQSVGVHDILMVDSKGIVPRQDCVGNDFKCNLAEVINPRNVQGSLSDALNGADVFIGVSKAGLLTKELIQTMAPDPIIFAMANPIPEVMPDIAKEAGAAVIGTGRSDFPNQINNVLAFPGIFRGALDARVKDITQEMKIAAAKAIASCVEHPTADKVIPSVFDETVAGKVADAVKNCAKK